MKKILNLLLPVFLLVLGVQFTRDYFGDTSKERKSNLEQLLAEGEEIVGILNNEYQEKDGYFELICVEIKKYDENFNYEINLLFAIHSKTNFVMDPYATYSCVFLKRQYTYVLKKVEREI